MSGSGPLGGDPHHRLGDLFMRWSSEFKEAEEDFHASSWGVQALVVIASVVGGLFLIVGAFPAFVWAAKALKRGEDAQVDRVSDAVSGQFTKAKGSERGKIGESAHPKLEEDVLV